MKKYKIHYLFLVSDEEDEDDLEDGGVLLDTVYKDLEVNINHFLLKSNSVNCDLRKLKDYYSYYRMKVMKKIMLLKLKMKKMTMNMMKMKMSKMNNAKKVHYSES